MEQWCCAFDLGAWEKRTSGINHWRQQELYFLGRFNSIGAVFILLFIFDCQQYIYIYIYIHTLACNKFRQY